MALHASLGAEGGAEDVDSEGAAELQALADY